MKKFSKTIVATGLLTLGLGITNVSAQEITVKSGDTLSGLGVKHKTSVSQLKTLNHLKSDKIYIGQKLVVSPTVKKTQATATKTITAKTYTVKAGDSLSVIAKKYGMTTAKLKSLNGLKSDLIRIGQVLKVEVKAVSTKTVVAPKTVKTTATSTYKVKSGDALSLIAKKYGMTTAELKSLNGLKNDLIRIGQVLKVKTVVTKTVSTSNTIVAKPATATTIKTYTVQSGDTLSEIAAKFNVSISQLKTWNKLTNDDVFIGWNLKVSQPTTQVATFNADAVIATGKQYLTVPYVWGGTTPSGFDCSGFLGYVFRQHDINLPRTVADIFKVGTTVSTPSKGDMVFFETYKAGPSHAGIYLGNNKFLHAGSTGGVQISDMTTSYWGPRYLGAKRYR